MNKSSLIKKLLTLLFIFCPLLSAQEEAEFDYFLYVENMVTGVSKKAQSIAEAPGIVSVLTQKDIQQLGVQTLSEALAFFPGIFTYDSFFTQYNQISLRGNLSKDLFNPRILLLVNGHPVFSPQNGGFELNSIPLEAVERIEVTRGPSSVLYGSNAFSGVIHIITRKGMQNSLAEIRVQHGSFNTNEIRATISQTFTDVSYFFSSTLRDQDGYKIHIRPDQDIQGFDWKHKVYSNFNSYFLNVSYKNLELDLNYWSQENNSKLGVLPSFLFKNDEFNQSSFYADLRYQYELNDHASLNVNLRFDESDFDFLVDNILSLRNLLLNSGSSNSGQVKLESETEKYGAEIFLNWFFSERLEILAGLLYDRFKGTEFPVIDTAILPQNFPRNWNDNSDKAIYFNFDFHWNDHLNLVGGTRFTENKKSGDNLDFKAGAVYKLSDNLSVKTLYGTSFRSPNFIELFSDIPGFFQGNERLNIETLEGVDIGIYFLPPEKNIIFSLSYFWNRTDDFISNDFTQNGLLYYNSNGYETEGLEYEIELNPLDYLNLFLVGTHLFNTENFETGNSKDYLVENMVNFGATVFPNQNIRISNSYLYRSRWEQADSYILSNLAVYYTPPVLNNHLEIFIIVNNLFDEEYLQAEFSMRDTDTIPGGPPRSIVSGISIKF